MPTYQYVCTDCAEPLEAQQSFTDDPLSVCPTCEGRLRKVFGAVGVVFKGSGFYRNDSRPAESNGSSDGDAKPAKPKEAATSNGTKPDTKTESKPTAAKDSAA